MISLNNLVNELFDSSVRTGSNIGREVWKYISHFRQYTGNIGELTTYPIMYPVKSLIYGTGLTYLLLKLTGCTSPEEKPPEPTPIIVPTNTQTPINMFTTYTFTKTNNACELEGENLVIGSNKDEGYDNRLIRIGSGTGYEISPGLILTAAHVVEDFGKKLLVYKGGKSSEGNVVYKDVINDLALVEVPSNGEINYTTRFRSTAPLNESVELRTINPIDTTYADASSQIKFLIKGRENRGIS